ncbi:MAG: DUF1549 and DUF1553 domain-containing protein [Gemmataceae bacterium]|nr:DUF1549 and DUF1553 domain-containing protein [Gemmataceae bacterium]
MPRTLPVLALAAVVATRGLTALGSPHDAPKPDAAATHWAFKTPARPAVPKATAWAANPIDAFVHARLQQEKLTPSPEADRVTLCRRLYLDLVGLPPTPEEVDAFVADTSPNAYEKLVDRLLASPHHGERWARVWLDAARYADSDGYEKDKSRQVWMYRDWVVNALNNDLPYDRFVTEQVAGDLLPNATQDQVVATGFVRMSMLNEEGGVDPEQFRMDAMFDRMDAVGRAVLGLSVACCQCHDHKFDPMTQEDYFRLFAFLNNDHEAQRVVYTPAERMAINQLRQKMRDAEDDLRRRTPDWQQRMAKWEAAATQGRPSWTTVAVENAGDNSQRYFPQADGSILAQGYAPTKFSTLMRGPSPAKLVTAFRLELLNDPNLPCGGPGRSHLGTCALTEFVVEVEKPGAKREKVKFVTATADFGNEERELEKCYDDKSGKRRVTGPVAFAIDGKDDTAWGIDAGPGRRNVPRTAVFVPEKPVDAAGATLHFNLKQQHGGWNSDDHMNHNLGRFRLSVTDAAGEVAADPVPARVREVLAIPAAQRTPAQVEAVFAYWRTTVPEFAAANDQVEQLWRQWPAGDTSLVVQARAEPRPTHILKRGNFLKPGDEVAAGVPAFLHPLPANADASRLTLAKWLTDTRSPTTARAFVNRVWQAYFGTGLVATPEEFGTQGEKPSHPELLDWLAVEFTDPSWRAAGRQAPGEAWSMKHLHRLIVTSATYRQASKVTPELLAKDPQNRLLARGARFRADAEVVRDVALSSSGLLNPKLGGPSVFAPAPQFLFDRPVSYGPFTWPEATGPDRYRRGLYTFRRRSTPYPALTVFDAPVGEASCVKRARSNTPLQALTGLNETVFVECARGLGLRALRHGGKTDAERLTYAFRLCVARKPAADELAVLQGLLEKHRKRFAAGEASAAEVATGEKQPKAVPPGIDLTDWAAYTLAARVLLNLDETITRE